MANVNISPMPLWARALPRRMRPTPPPIFDSEPTPADIELARELFDALDPDSQDWYSGAGIFARHSGQTQNL
jgi:hypothetical protein